MIMFEAKRKQDLQALERIAEDAGALDSELACLAAFAAGRTVAMRVSGRIGGIDAVRTELELVPYEDHAALHGLLAEPEEDAGGIIWIPRGALTVERGSDIGNTSVAGVLLSALADVLAQVGNRADGQISGYLVLRPQLLRGVRDGSLTFVRRGDGVLTTLRDNQTGQFAGHGTFSPHSPTSSSWIPTLMRVAAVATAQYYLARIEQRLDRIDEGIREIQQHLDDELDAKLIASCRTVRRELNNEKPDTGICERELRVLQEISLRLRPRFDRDAALPIHQTRRFLQALVARYVAAQLLYVHGDEPRANDAIDFITADLAHTRKELASYVVGLEARMRALKV